MVPQGLSITVVRKDIFRVKKQFTHKSSIFDYYMEYKSHFYVFLIDGRILNMTFNMEFKAFYKPTYKSRNVSVSEVREKRMFRVINSSLERTGNPAYSLIGEVTLDLEVLVNDFLTVSWGEYQKAHSGWGVGRGWGNTHISQYPHYIPQPDWSRNWRRYRDNDLRTPTMLPSDAFQGGKSFRKRSDWQVLEYPNTTCSPDDIPQQSTA